MDILNLIAAFLNPVATIVVGLVAWILYRKQKRDQKIDAARILVNAFRAIDKAITSVRNGQKLNDKKPLAEFKEWENNKHLFIRDFDHDELQFIDDYLDNYHCAVRQFHEVVTLSQVNKEEKFRILQRKIADHFDRLSICDADDDKTKEENKRWSFFDTNYQNDPSAPVPKSLDDNIKEAFNALVLLLPTEIGSKFKKIAQLKD